MGITGFVNKDEKVCGKFFFSVLSDDRNIVVYSNCPSGYNIKPFKPVIEYLVGGCTKCQNL